MTNGKTILAATTLSRRDVLKGLAVASTCLTASLWVPLGHARRTTHPRFAQPSPRNATAAPTATAPAGLTAAETEILAGVVAAILPSDRTPGAADTGSAAFVASAIEARGAAALTAFKQALAAVDGIALQLHGIPFARLPSSAQHEVVKLVAGMPALAVFWYGVRTLAVLHFYAQPDGYRPIGLPGPNIDRGGYPDAMRHTRRECVALDD